MASPSLGNFGAKFLQTSFPLYPILCKSAIVILREQKTIDSNNFTVSSMSSLQNAWLIKRKVVYTLVLFHIQVFRERLLDKMCTRNPERYYGV